MTTFTELLERLVREAEEEFAWQLHLSLNELLHGSAYGPWPPPREFLGLQVLLEDMEPGDNPFWRSTQTGSRPLRREDFDAARAVWSGHQGDEDRGDPHHSER